MNNIFDQIRSYTNEEIPQIMENLCNEKQFINVATTAYPLLPKEMLKKKLRSFTDVYTFQKEIIYPFLHNIEASKTKGISLVGLENLDRAAPYLYISNHRDIVLDAGFLCIKFIEQKMDTVEVAVGDNLLIFRWIEQLVRVNKSFIVRRGLGMRQMLESSRLLSAYIRYTLGEKRQSVWMAQREGRAKDSDDCTQDSILKMLNMSGKPENAAENLAQLNICPLSISYEYDPCDYLKAKEFQQKRDNADFKKNSADDLLNMQTGVMGYKGQIVYNFAGSISSEITDLQNNISDKTAFFRQLAALIDSKIHSRYHIYKVNKIAFDLLNNSQKFAADYSIIEKLDFERYLAKQIDKIDLADKDHNFLMRKLLEMYANPLKNQLRIKN